MKKIFLGMVIILVALCVLVSCGEDENKTGKPNENPKELKFTTVSDENIQDGLKITGYTGELPSELVIPSEIDDKKVVSIGQGAFTDESITSLELPETMKYIYGSAFNGCKQLKTLKMFSVGFWDLHYSGIGSFINCPIENLTCYAGTFEMETLDFLKQVKNLNINGGSVGMNEFDQNRCPSLQTLYIGEGVRSIAEGAFYGDRLLVSVTFHENSVTTIGHGAFAQCLNLKTVVLSKNLEYLDYAAFGDTNISQIIIPASVTHIGQGALSSSNLYAAHFEDFNGWYLVKGETETPLDPVDVGNAAKMSTLIKDNNEAEFVKK